MISCFNSLVRRLSKLERFVSFYWILLEMFLLLFFCFPLWNLLFFSLLSFCLVQMIQFLLLVYLKAKRKHRNSFERNIKLTVCYYHVTYEFPIESTLYSLPECQGTLCSKQGQYLKFKRQQQDLNPQRLSL